MSTIFVSSTFQDMQQERDILQNDVLPRIKAFAKQYGKNIDFCDLRWGVNSLGMDEAASTRKVLQVCFDEIDESRPFFIAFLGDRYGWIPDADTVKTSIAGRPIKAADFINKSVTEMEIIYGALSNLGEADVHFYFREITNKRKGLLRNPDLPAYYTSQTADDKKRMKLLKNRIRSHFPNQVRTYAVSWNAAAREFDGMDSLAESLYRDIRDAILHRWGQVPALSEYEYQFYQYQYAFDSDHFFRDRDGSLLSDHAHPDNLKLNEPDMESQNYVLISEDEHGLNRLFSSLCARYRAEKADILPYDCSQSVLSASTENMLLYFVSMLEGGKDKRANIQSDADSQGGSSPVKAFHRALARVDEALDHPLILAIRGIQYLDNENIFDWLPLERYRNVHFLLSGNKDFSGPSRYNKLTREFYFSKGVIFSRTTLIKAFMTRSHKEIDDQVCFTLLDKARNKDDQYLELLMQKLLVLSREDYESIKNSGDGIESISRYLQTMVKEAPDNAAGIILSKLAVLEKETSRNFVRSVLAILSVLPFGISLTDLSHVLQAGNVAFTKLDMTLLYRSMSSIVNVTLDGYYRMVNTPASKILSDILSAEKAEWSVILQRYMSQKSTDRQESAQDFYRSQYLDVSLRTGKQNALSLYLKNTGYDAAYTSLILRRLVTEDRYTKALKDNFSHVTLEDIRWMAEKLYSYLSERKLLLNKDFAVQIISFWKTMLPCWKALGEPSEEKNYIRFRLLFEIGELSYLHDLDDADRYLVEAKKVSKENFRQYPNRIWKTLHGIELTEEEKRRGYDSVGLDDDLSGSGSVMLGFSGEIEDMEFEQSWSITVRVINNYLASIYHKRGDTQAAEALEKESKTLTHIADPNPQGKGRAEVASGIQIIWPDALNGDPEATKKRPYDPQFRRNSAIQMAKEAKKLLKNDEKEKALSQYLASNEILKEIYEDGHTGEYYNLIGIQGDLDEIRIMLQKECARDLGLNFSGMISCTPLREDNADLIAYIDDMLAWAHIYDDYRNNKQSKADLENYYLISAQVYNLFDDVAVHCHRIIHDIDQFYTYRLEAHQKGEQTDQAIMEDRDKANHVLYAVATANPHMGAQITDLLLRQSNASVKANDFNGFLSLTQLVENLLLWTGKNSQDWVGTHCSLEYIYFHNMNNQTMLWEKHGMADRLAQDADRILRLLPNARESENVLMGIESVVRHIMQVFGMGEYKKAVPYADAVLAAIRKTVDLPEVELAQIYEKVIATYSEAGLAEKAHAVAMDYEALLDRIEQKGYPEHLRSTDFTPAQFHGFVVKSKLIAYLNHAIALSRMEREEDAKRYLQRAESLAVKNPEIAAQNPGIVQRITLFRKNGLPKPKNLLDNEKVYRKYRDEIEATLSRYLRKAPYTVSDLQHIESLIRKMCAIPEHEIFKNTYALAKYHHVLNMLYAAVGRKDLAFNMLRNAAEIADSADFVDELFAKIYSDIIAYISGTGEQLMYTHKALRIYENLQKEGAQYSQNSYAMALHNASIIYMQQGDLLQALSYVKKALALWERIYSSTPDEQIMAYMGEAKRLIAFLETKIL